MPASLSAVLARIGAIQARFGGAAATTGDTSTFADVLNQVSGTLSGADGDGTASSLTAQLGKLPQSERDLIVSQARREGVDPALALAVVLQESGGNPSAVSPAGAMGLMQLMPGTAQELGVTRPLDPTQNLAGGLDYLRQKLTEFGSVPLALAAYNAGSGAVSAWGGVPPYPETQAYVSNILRARDGIARELASGTPVGSSGQVASGTSAGSSGAAPAHRGATGGPGTAAPGAGSNAGARQGQVSAPASSGSSGGAKPAGPASVRPDGVPNVLAPRQSGDPDLAFVRGGQVGKAADGQGASSSGTTVEGSATVLQARVDAAVGTAATGKDAGRRGADAAPAVGLDGALSGNSGQAQVGGGGSQGIGQGMNQNAQGSATSGPGPSGGNPPAASAGLQGRGTDGPAAGAPGGGSVSHVTIRSGGDLPVTVTLTDRSDAVSARVVTPTPDMAQTLRDHAGALRAALASHQVQLSDLAVRPASSDRSSNGQPQGGSHRSPRSAQNFQMPDSEEDTHEFAGA